MAAHIHHPIFDCDSKMLQHHFTVAVRQTIFHRLFTDVCVCVVYSFQMHQAIKRIKLFNKLNNKFSKFIDDVHAKHEGEKTTRNQIHRALLVRLSLTSDET